MEANLSTLAPRQPDRREAETVRKFSFLRRVLTPRTVFMEIGSSDCELSVRAASYVERVWCVDAQRRVSRPPCNLRWDAMGGVPLESIYVAFSERFADP